MFEMKLLFDQNISYRILRLLPENFSNCCHLRSVGLLNCNDVEIWLFAKQKGFTLVTFDADFLDIAILNGFPPKIVWLRTGNLTTPEIADRIILNSSIITAFIDDPEQYCLEIY